MAAPAWTDWLTDSCYRIRVAPAAMAKLRALPVEMQDRLRQMLHDIAELADLVPPLTARSWGAGHSTPLLQLQVGRVNVRYSISEQNRTLSIEHVILPEDEEELSDVG